MARKTPNPRKHPMRYSQIEIAVRKFSAQKSEFRKLATKVAKLELSIKQLRAAISKV
jgi:hypothetical protein